MTTHCPHRSHKSTIETIVYLSLANSVAFLVFFYDSRPREKPYFASPPEPFWRSPGFLNTFLPPENKFLKKGKLTNPSKVKYLSGNFNKDPVGYSPLHQDDRVFVRGFSLITICQLFSDRCISCQAVKFSLRIEIQRTAFRRNIKCRPS